MKGYNPLWTMICAGAVVYLMGSPVAIWGFVIYVYLLYKTR